MTPSRRRVLSALILLTVMAVTLTRVLHETDMRTQYGMARIDLAGQKVYIKARTCGMNCRAELWITRSSDRCRRPDPAEDYIGVNNTVTYAVQGQTLFLVAEPQALHPPQTPWLDLRFLPPYGHAADAYPLRSLSFAKNLAPPGAPGEQIDLSTCVRAFGHTWN